MSGTAIDISEDDKRRHREAEKSLKEVGLTHLGDICGSSEELDVWLQAKQKLASQVKVRR